MVVSSAGMNQLMSRTVANDWEVVARLLPSAWEVQARTLGALRRMRGISDAGTLLRVLLIHLAGGCSLIETAVRAKASGLCSVSPVAVFKRLKASEQWLRWLAEQLWRQRRGVWTETVYGRRPRVVDATVVSEGGRTGSQWRVHYAIDLANLQCDFFELTDVRGGESFRRLPVRAGDLILGDRGYARAPGIAHVAQRGADILVRVHAQSLPLFEAQGRRISLLRRVRNLQQGACAEWPAWVQGPGEPIAGRLVAMKRSEAAAQRVRLRMQRRARHNQQSVSNEALNIAGYVLVWTTLPASSCTAADVMKMYRWRWQIELAIKRMKSILGLGQLPKRTDVSSRAWLHGKLFVALLMDRLWTEAETLSPWGYPLETASQPLAGNVLFTP